MKNKLKRLLSVVLAFAMVLSTFGIVVSANSAALTAIETDTGNVNANSEKIYEMAFTITMDSIRSLAIAFSYDTTAIQPVDPYSNNEDVIMSTDESASTANGYAFDGYSSGRNELKVQGAKYVISGDRAGICPTVSTTSAFSATAGVTALKFYYRIKDASKMNRETFKFETDYGTGSILATLYPVKNEAAAIVANGSYKYGAADGTVDSFAAPTWTYTGSDVPATGGGSGSGGSGTDEPTYSAALTAIETDTGNVNANSEKIYEMAFTITMDSIRSLAIAFSYDTTAIQPVDPYSNNEDVIMSTDESASTANGYAFDGYSSGRNELKVQGAKYVISGDRAGICPTVSTTSAFSATAGVTALKFYYRIKDASKMNRETFKFETDYGTGSILATLYPVKNEAAAIVANGSYKYGAADGVTADSFATPTWTYTNSTVAPSAPAKTPVDISVITIEGEKVVTLPAALNLTLGNVPSTVNAHIEYEVDGAWVTTAPTAAGTYNVKVVATVVDADAYEITGTAAIAQVTINPEPAPEKTTPDVSGVEFADVTKTYDGAAATIAKPDVSAIAGIADATVTYSSGAAPVNAGTYTATLTFTVTDETLYNVPAPKTANIVINKKAATFTIDDTERTYGSELPGFGGEWSGLVDESHKSSFDLRWACDATATSDVGEYEINATYTENSNYELTVVPGTLTINKAPATVDAITVETLYASAVSSIENLESRVWNRAMRVTAKFGNNLTEEIDVEKWTFDSENEFNIKGGTYTLTAVLEENDNLTIADAPKATITITPVTVTSIDGIAPITVTSDELANATALSDLGFPVNVTVNYSDGTSETLEAEWDVEFEDLADMEVGNSIDVTLTNELPAWATVDAAKTKFTFSVTDKTPVSDVVVDIEDTVYGTALGAPTASSATVADLDFTFEYAGTTAAGRWIEKTTEAPTEAGSYKVYATIDSDLYAGEGSTDFVIEPKEATFTVNDDERDYGAVLTDYVGSGEFDGLVYEDTAEDFEIVYTTTAGDVPNVGTYDITATATNANYDVTVVAGTLTINKMPLSETGITPVVNEEDGTYTATMDVADGQVTFEWYVDGVKVATGATFTPDAITYSNKVVIAKAVAAENGNYEGEVESIDEYTIAKYDISESEFCVDWTLDENDVFAIGETATVDFTSITDYEKLIAAGATFEVYWKTGADAEYTKGEATYTVKDGDYGWLAVKVVATGDFTGEIEIAEVAEIGKMPLIGEITLTITEGVVSYTLSEELAALDGNFDIVWYVNGEVKAVDGDTYTMGAEDQTVFVMAQAKGDIYSGNVMSNIIGLPSDVVITSGITKNSITVTLSASANGFDIEKYIVAIGEETPVEVVANESGAFTYTFTGLTPKTTYTISAIAVNAIGESEAETADITTKAAFSGGTTGGGTGSSSTSKPNNNKTEDKTEDKTDDTTTTTPVVDTEVKVEVSEPSATVDAKDLEGKETVSATVETADGTKVDITADVKDSEVASLTVAADKADAEVTGKAAAGAVTEPIVITVDAKDADNNAVEVTTDVAIPAETEAYAYAVDEMGNTTRLDSVYNAETGMVEVLDVADGTVVVLSTVAPAEFADVDGRWSEKEIQNAADLGLVNGKLDSKFDPSNNLTRSESFKLQKNIIDALGLALEASADAKIDTNASDWAYESDLWAAQAGITTGTGSLEDGTIVVSGNANITRQDYVTAVARMLKRVIDVEYEIEGKVFADAHNVAEYATDAVAYLSGLGIINGTEAANGMLFNPTSNITREEAAAISNRVYAYVAGILAAK